MEDGFKKGGGKETVSKATNIVTQGGLMWRGLQPAVRNAIQALGFLSTAG